MLQNNDQVDVKKAPDEEVNDVDFHRYDEQVCRIQYNHSIKSSSTFLNSCVLGKHR